MFPIYRTKTSDTCASVIIRNDQLTSCAITNTKNTAVIRDTQTSSQTQSASKSSLEELQTEITNVEKLLESFKDNPSALSSNGIIQNIVDKIDAIRTKLLQIVVAP